MPARMQRPKVNLAKEEKKLKRGIMSTGAAGNSGGPEIDVKVIEGVWVCVYVVCLRVCVCVCVYARERERERKRERERESVCVCSR